MEETAQSNSEFSSVPKRRQSNRYIDNSDVNDPPENVHLTNYKTNRIQGEARNNDLDKRTIDTQSSSLDDSDSLYENNRENRNDEKVQYNNNEVEADSNEQPRHLKHYYNTMQSEHKSMLGDRSYEFANRDRDRRQAEQSDSLKISSTEKSYLSDISNEEDEAAIKRHIRKLSGDELEELLNSLSDDKKALLNKIMDSDNTYETVNKREITKKAGAVEENGYMDSSLSEISKVQGGPSININTESAVSASSDLDNNKQSQTESGDVGNSKTSEATRTEPVENKAELTGQINVSADIKSDSSLNNFEASPDTSNVQSSKSESKRQTNLDYVKNPDSSFDDEQTLDNYFNAKDSDDSFNDQDNICSQDDELAQLMDEEALLHSNNERQYKREALETQADLDDSIKSLEESFPNSNCDENGQYFESNMAPLVRVKRKNQDKVVNKRAAIDLPETKVAFFPYKAENDDEDNDEGSEFDDDGFYDRNSNYAKSNANKPDKMVTKNHPSRSMQLKNSDTNEDNDSKSVESSNVKMESDTMSLGSDTDSVLSGVEGVDDNLMFSSGNRNRRTVEDKVRLADNEQNRPRRSTPLLDEVKSSENYINLPNYQENDAFGPLPRSEGELSRFKRIRRVKPSPTSDITAAGK